MSKGRFGVHGGQYIPETLMNEIQKLEEAYEFYKKMSSLIKNSTHFSKNMRADLHFFTMQRR